MKEDRLDLLLHALFEESLGEAERVELNDMLAASSPARARYRRAAALQSALVRRAAAPSYFESPAPEKVVPSLDRDRCSERGWRLSRRATFDRSGPLDPSCSPRIAATRSDIGTC